MISGTGFVFIEICNLVTIKETLKDDPKHLTLMAEVSFIAIMLLSAGMIS